tara:strand:+ start:24308 stop:24625 length:318 start_codon:yes stop_codon:yes gene_type:complete
LERGGKRKQALLTTQSASDLRADRRSVKHMQRHAHRGLTCETLLEIPAIRRGRRVRAVNTCRIRSGDDARSPRFNVARDKGDGRKAESAALHGFFMVFSGGDGGK